MASRAESAKRDLGTVWSIFKHEENAIRLARERLRKSDPVYRDKAPNRPTRRTGAVASFAGRRPSGQSAYADCNLPTRTKLRESWPAQ